MEVILMVFSIYTYFLSTRGLLFGKKIVSLQINVKRSKMNRILRCLHHMCTRHSLVTMGLLLSLSLPLLLSCNSKKGEPKDASSSPPPAIEVESKEAKVGKLITNIQKCSRLYTAEYKIHKVITHEDILKLKGSILGFDYDFDVPSGSRSIAIPLDATEKGYIDFSQFNEDNVIYDDDHLEIILPDPKAELTSTKVNHDEVQSYVALLRKNFSDEELSVYEKEGRESILRSIPQLNIAERSRLNASRILIPLLRQLDISEENITITFRKDFDERRLTTITN